MPTSGPSVTTNAVAVAASPRSTNLDAPAAQSLSMGDATFRPQDDFQAGDDVEGDADADEEDEEGEHLDGSEAHHNMINETTVKSGYLEKKGEKRKTWKKRWFVLRSSKLAYYKNDKEYQLLRFIDVGDIKTVASVELKKSVNTFGIVTPKRTFYVRASSKSDMESWIEALNEVKTQYAQSSTMTQEMAEMELTDAPAPSSTLSPSRTHVSSSLAPVQSQRRSGSQERSPSATAIPIKVGIPGHGDFSAPAQPRPIPGSAAFSPLAATSDSETGAERYGLSYTSSAGPSISSSPTTRTDLSQPFLLAGQSPGGGGSHTSGSELSDVGGHQRQPSAGFGSFPRQRSISATRRLASASSGAADQPASPIFPPGGGGGQVLSSSDEEDEWDEEEIADQAMPLPALGSSQTSQTQQQAFTPLQAHPQQQATQGQAPPLSISSVPPGGSDLIRDPNKVITQGYLMKQSGRRKVWRKRWFVLTTSRLLYSRSHMDAKAHRQIPISSMLDAIEYEPKKATSGLPMSPGIGSPSSNPFGLENSGPGAFGDREGGSAFSPGTGASSALADKPERRGSMVAAAAGVASNMTAGMVGGSKKRKENCFQIITPKRTFVLCAPGEDEEIKWISALKVLITRQRNGQTPNVNPPLSPSSLGGASASAFPFYTSNSGVSGGGGSNATLGSTGNKYASSSAKSSVTSAGGQTGASSPLTPTGVTARNEASANSQLASIGAAAYTLSNPSPSTNHTPTMSTGNYSDTSTSHRHTSSSSHLDVTPPTTTT